MGLLSAIALSLPIIMLLITRLAWYKSFPALFFYYAFVLAYLVLLLGYFNFGPAFRYNLGVLNNLLDAPLMLLFLLYFSKTPTFRKRMLMAVLAFVVFEIVVVAVYGFNPRATTIVLAPGLVVVLTITLLFFIHQVKIAVVYHRAVGKAVMIASLLFAYVGYCFVYAVFYLIKPAYKDDAHLVYFLITIFSCLIMSTGIFIERKRVNSLTELQTTREELKAIYGEQDTKKIAAPLEPAILNFDKKDWH
jgi:hypothetical protein